MSRKDILKAFKALHRITQTTFEGDQRALLEARQKINQEFRKSIAEEEIQEKLKVAKDVGDILKNQVVQLSKKHDSHNFGMLLCNRKHQPNKHLLFLLFLQIEMKLRKDTIKLDNVIFKEDAIMPPPRSKKCKPDAN